MKNENKNNKDFDDLLAITDQFKPSKAKKSKEQVWAELELLIEKPIKKDAVVRSIKFRQLRVAASIALIISFSTLAVFRFYTKNVICLPGNQTTAYLPDGSIVQLNSKSSLSFHPLWWKINREVNLEGEGFFKVKKGEKFTVISSLGTTSVLGTSFNIFARDKDYEVTCLTGKVRVLSLLNKNEIIITPNQMVVLNNTGNLEANLNVNAKLAVNWSEGKFVFTQRPLNKVLAEIARRYGVEIQNSNNLSQLYTGNFIKEKDVEITLAIICKTFDLEYKKLPSGTFVMQ
jgi:transmembrane sensor